jgi:hypothetical protein
MFLSPRLIRFTGRHSPRPGRDGLQLCEIRSDASHTQSAAKADAFILYVVRFLPVSKIVRRQHHVRICDGRTSCPDCAEARILPEIDISGQWSLGRWRRCEPGPMNRNGCRVAGCVQRECDLAPSWPRDNRPGPVGVSQRPAVGIAEGRIAAGMGVEQRENRDTSCRPSSANRISASVYHASILRHRQTSRMIDLDKSLALPLARWATCIRSLATERTHERSCVARAAQHIAN